MSGGGAGGWQEGGGLWIDEEPLREWILKAYHDPRAGERENRALLAAVRELLSGPEGGPSVPGQYYFLTDPDRLIPGFVGSLERQAEGLSRAVYQPILTAAREREAAGEEDLVPNLGVYVASLAGPIALRTGVDETIACSLVSGALLTLARLGGKRLQELLERAGGAGDS